MNKLGIKVMLSAPYSYAGAPCELFFAYFKQGYLNKRGESTGKK